MIDTLTSVKYNILFVLNYWSWLTFLFHYCFYYLLFVILGLINHTLVIYLLLAMIFWYTLLSYIFSNFGATFLKFLNLPSIIWLIININAFITFLSINWWNGNLPILCCIKTSVLLLKLLNQILTICQMILWLPSCLVNTVTFPFNKI